MAARGVGSDKMRKALSLLLAVALLGGCSTGNDQEAKDRAAAKKAAAAKRAAAAREERLRQARVARERRALAKRTRAKARARARKRAKVRAQRLAAQREAAARAAQQQRPPADPCAGAASDFTYDQCRSARGLPPDGTAPDDAPQGSITCPPGLVQNYGTNECIPNDE